MRKNTDVTEGLTFIDRTLGSKVKFRRLVILVLVITPLVIGSVGAWKGCEIDTKHNHIKVKGAKK